jgi:HK97 gp10 family phage protein
MPVTVRLTGAEKAISAVNALPGRIRNRAVRVALNAAGGEFKSEVKTRAPKETGLLKRSIGVKVAVPYQKNKPAWVKVGPQRGFRQPVEKNKKGKVRTVSKKIQNLLPESSKTKYRNPTRYAHLVEGGTKRGVKATRFMALSASLRQGAAVAKMESKLRTAVWNYNNT